MNKSLPAKLKKAQLELSSNDLILGEVIALSAEINLAPRHNYFESLSKSIISQQVSVAAAKAIFSRFKEGTKLKPDVIEQMELEELKEFGLSRQKCNYIKDLATHFVEDKNVFSHLDTLDDTTVIEELTAVKGIGSWTAKMFLMFTLVRLDVFAEDDLGLQKAIIALYPNAGLDKAKDFLEFADRWKPYRTVACWYLWKSIDTPAD